MTGPNAVNLTLLEVVIEQGHVRALTDRRYPLHLIVGAHSYVDRGHKGCSEVRTIRT